jgi:hypothetical protein
MTRDTKDGLRAIIWCVSMFIAVGLFLYWDLRHPLIRRDVCNDQCPSDVKCLDRCTERHYCPAEHK